ncbi:MAG: energy transducer TonB [Rikenellaceae bacterium]
MATPNDKKETKAPKLRLPFTNEKVDMGVWAFDHRIGLCVTVIVYLLFAIVFVSAKIFVGAEQHTQGFYVDLQDIAALEELRDKLQEEVEEKQDFDWESVSNRTSNELSLDQRVVDDRGTDASQLNNEAAKAQESMEANRQAYLEALNQIESDREQSRNEDQKESAERRDIKQKGNVTVSYSFANPVRHAQELIVPAYQCQGGGEVVVAAQLNSQGKVTKAEIERGGDKCMQETALKAARASSFNIAPDAPNPHSGTITYIFIPQ